MSPSITNNKVGGHEVDLLQINTPEHHCPMSTIRVLVHVHGPTLCLGCALVLISHISISSFPLRLALVFVSPLAPPSFSFSLVLSLSFAEWREHQRDQAGLVYWKQMADQRQEGQSFMKRGLNMPGPCRGACPWMMATWCVCVIEHWVEYGDEGVCVGWGGRWGVDFCRLVI